MRIPPTRKRALPQVDKVQKRMFATNIIIRGPRLETKQIKRSIILSSGKDAVNKNLFMP